TRSRHAALAATLRTAGNLRRFSPLSHSVMTPAAMIAVPAIALLWLAGFAEDAAGFVVSTSPSHAVATEAGRLHQRQLQPQQHRCCRQQARGLAETRMKTAADNVVGVKSKLLQLAAVMDRGGMANPGVSNAYLGTKDDMRLLVESLAELDPVNSPITPSQLSGRWELVYTTVELFRASPFFQMVEAGYDDPDKSNLFFKLHQLQTGSWGASSIGRITQTLDLIDSASPSTKGATKEVEAAEAAAAKGEEGKVQGNVTSNSTALVEVKPISGSLESEVDLIILPLTSLPLVGFWKLLPTFGGCIATKAKCALTGDNNEVVELVVESTKLKAVEDVPLLPLAGQLFEGMEFPTGDVAKKVMGNVPVTKQTVVFMDDSLRVMEDKAGELYIYAR
ncbi:unnamed protein product, partial [Pylaiella littoralis]